ncbi:MAG: hypothetical protein ACRD0P_02710 [Stackebrandtia sp.]
MSSSRGVLVVAFGADRFIDQAGDLAATIRRWSPQMAIALVTDGASGEVAGFDRVARIRTPDSADCRIKLDMDVLSPFDETLYVDADSFAVGVVEPIFDACADSDVAVFGHQIASGTWYGDVTRMRRRAGSASIPKFNGGCIYFRRTKRTADVFAFAREVAEEYADLELTGFGGGIADEPLLSIALARHGIAATDITATTMATPIGITGPMRVDVLSGRCCFAKQHRIVEPVLVHFAADFGAETGLCGVFYRRERFKLRARLAGWPVWLARTCAGVRFGPRCALFNGRLRVTGRLPCDPVDAVGIAPRTAESAMGVQT